MSDQDGKGNRTRGNGLGSVGVVSNVSGRIAGKRAKSFCTKGRGLPHWDPGYYGISARWEGRWMGPIKLRQTMKGPPFCVAIGRSRSRRRGLIPICARR